MKVPFPGLRIDGPTGVGSVELVQPLGQGAFGSVFEGRDLASGTRVAVKFPHVGVFGGTSELQAFRNEVLAAKEIRHPNVVSVLFVDEQGSADTPPYLIMEFVGGGTLQRFLDGRRGAAGQLPLDALRVSFDQLIDGIEAVNARMLHRDLKPDNILVDGATLKISDFGLSKIVGASTRSATFKGQQHLLYMAPEAWRLESNRIQLDMYAMGIVMFEMATLALPYDTPPDWRDVDRWRQMHLLQPAKLARRMRSDLPVAVEQLLVRLLEKRADDRFDTWAAVRAAVERAWFAEQPGVPVDRAVQRLLAASSEARHSVAQREAEAERARLVRQERQQLDDLQKDKLLDQIRSAVERINSASNSDKIVLRGSGDSYALDVPDVGVVGISFHRLDEEVRLRRGRVRLFATVRAADGIGFNAVLVRSDAADLYGAWEAWQMRVHALIDPSRMPPRPEPFGFQDASEFVEHFRHSEGGAHVYTYARLPDTDFAPFLAGFAERVARGRQ